MPGHSGGHWSIHGVDGAGLLSVSAVGDSVECVAYSTALTLMPLLLILGAVFVERKQLTVTVQRSTILKGTAWLICGSRSRS